MNKTNVMRILDREKVAYEFFEYDETLTDGISVAKALSQDVDSVFKTLVTVAASGENLVFVIPVAETLDLKKAARVANVKSVEMLKQKELFPLTGYIHGGCSPIGMKKQFRTFIDETCECFDRVCVSAGHVGCQVKLNPDDLCRVADIKRAPLT